MILRVASLILLFSSLCLEWGGEVHQLVALIAETQLTSAAEAMVFNATVVVSSKAT